MANNFKPKEWSHNGPKLLTRVLLKQVCHTSLPNTTPEKCGGFKVLPAHEFYPINYDDWEHLFNAQLTEKVIRTVENATIVHLWNHLSSGKIVRKSQTKTTYEIIAAKHCPVAFKASGAYF